MNDSFFGKNGTMQGLMDFAKDYSEGVSKGYQNIQGMKSGNAVERLDSLIKSIGAIVALLV